MHRAIEETERRRAKQIAFNEEHGITPRGVNKAVRELIDGVVASDPTASLREDVPDELIRDEKAAAREIKRLEKEMMDHARNLEFEQAAAARDKLQRLKAKLLMA
jgi:excinuclease ABC subunit B